MNEITVRVQYYNIIRYAVGWAEENVSVPAGTVVREMLARLCDRHPQLPAIILAADGTLAPHLVVFVNSKLQSSPDLEQPLQSGDQVLLFPAISGG